MSSDELGDAVDADRAALLAAAARARPVPHGLDAAGDRIEARLLDEERAVGAAAGRLDPAREHGGDRVAVVGVDEDAAAGVHRAAQRGEDGEVVVFAAVAERAEDVKGDVEAAVVERRA